MTQSAGKSAPTSSRDGTRLAALLILLLTAAVAFTWSHVKLLSQDEIFVLQTDSVSSLRELINIQRHYPISLDPLVFHVLAHACTKLFGPTALALRLPSIFGFLADAGLHLLRDARHRRLACCVDCDGVSCISLRRCSMLPKPVLMACCLAFMRLHSWRGRLLRAAAKDATGSLIILAVAIALTLNTHYFGILILVPICIAEFIRTLLRRRVDWVAGDRLAILIGMAGIVFALPFQKAAGEFRKHYYNAGAISVRAVSQAYRSLFVNYTTQPLAIQRLEDVLLVVFALGLIVLCALSSAPEDFLACRRPSSFLARARRTPALRRRRSRCSLRTPSRSATFSALSSRSLSSSRSPSSPGWITTALRPQ